MTSLSETVADAVAASYDFSRLAHVVDVGGGHGALLAAVLRAHPRLTGTVFDQDHAVAQEPPAGLESRWSAASGSFFESVPPADGYLLKSILHDWPDDECVAILRRCREALRPGGVVLVVEMVLGRPGHEREAAFSDLNMLVRTGRAGAFGGRVRRAARARWAAADPGLRHGHAGRADREPDGLTTASACFPCKRMMSSDRARTLAVCRNQPESTFSSSTSTSA